MSSARALRRLVSLGALLAPLALVACGGLPTRQEIRTVRVVTADEPRADVDLRRIPALPEQGQTPEAVVRGFLAAGAELDVARQFLTPDNRWDPEAGAAVFDGTPTVTTDPAALPDATSVTVSVGLDVVLRIARDGSTRPDATSGEPFSLVLVRPSERDQWRISSVPDVLPLRGRDLAQARRPGTLTWLAPGGRTLLADPVLLPSRRDALLATAVDRLLAGPSARLAEVGVASALPTGTSAVRVVQSGDEVLVDLAAVARATPPAQKALARAQVAGTLLSLPGVAAVRVLVDGQPFLPPGVRDDAPLTSADVAAVAAAGGPGGTPPAAYVVGAGGHVEPLGSREEPVAAGGTVALAVAGDGQRTATLRRGADGAVTLQVAQTPGATGVQVGGVGGWSSVSWARDGGLWLVRDGRPMLRREGQEPQPVDAGGALLRSLLVAPDGVHAVAVSSAGGLMAGLVSSSPPRLTDLHPVARRLRQVSRVAFDPAGPGVVLATGRVQAPGDESATAVWRVSVGVPDPTTDDLDGRPVQLPPPCARAAVESLGGGPGQQSLAGCPDGTVRRLSSGDVWEPAGGGRLPTWSTG